VTESTQLAVDSVLNRIDVICQRQNGVFQQLQLANQLIGEARDKLLDFRQVLRLFSTEAAVALAENRKKYRAVTFDAGATLKDREQRQKLADEVNADFKNKERG